MLPCCLPVLPVPADLPHPAPLTLPALLPLAWLQDLSRAWQVAERLEYGMVGVNEVAITAEVRPGLVGL